MASVSGYMYTSGLLLPKNYMKNGLTSSFKYWLKKVVLKEREVVRENGIYWKDQKDDLDGVTIPTPYLQQFSRFEANRHNAVQSVLNGSM